MSIETYGAYGPIGIKLVKLIGKKIRMLLVKNCLLFIYSQKYQWQYVQQGNAVCDMGCVKEQSSGLEGQFNFQVHGAEELL